MVDVVGTLGLVWWMWLGQQVSYGGCSWDIRTGMVDVVGTLGLVGWMWLGQQVSYGG